MPRASQDADRRRRGHRLRLHAAGPRRARRSAAADAGAARCRRRPRQPGRHRRLCRSGDGSQPCSSAPCASPATGCGAATSTTRAAWGIANAYAALEVGITRFDACLAGIGGCPHAPGASGNVDTEDLVFMLESMGVATGIDSAEAARPCADGWRAGSKAKACTARCGARAFRRPSRRDGGSHRHERWPSLKHRRKALLPPPPAADRHPRGRVHPHGHGPDLRHGAGRPGRRGHQGRAHRWRPHAPPAGRGRGLLPHVQPQQEEHRARPAAPAGAGSRAAPVRHAPTWWRRTSSPAPWTSTAWATPRSAKLNPRLMYVNHTGFLPGPYEHRTALDEVVQMMGGLAYMTGRPGDPLRAGTSVNDIMGGMFGAIGALAALMQRARDRQGAGGAVGTVREQRLPGRPAHAAVRDHRPGRPRPCPIASRPGRCTTCSP